MPRNFNDWIAAYTDLFDPITETPTHLHFWTAVSTIAGALTRRVWIDEVTFRYYPNFCIIFVAPPGVVSKSTTMSHGMSLLRQLPHIKFAADTTTYPAFTKALADAHDPFIEINNDDPAKSDWINQCAMTAAISELGTFLKIEDEDSVNGFTDLLDCRDTAIKDTKNNGKDVIEFPYVNIIGCTTPLWIQDKLKSQIGGWGLSSRIIFIYADTKKQYLWSPAEAVAGKRIYFEKRRELLIRDLQKIGGLCGEATLTKDAAERCREWYNETQQHIEEYSKTPEFDNWVGYFLARKPVHVRKLSMILSVSRRDDLKIDLDSIDLAIKTIDEVEQDITKVFRVRPTPSANALQEQAILERLVGEVGAMDDQSIRKITALSRIARFVDSTTAGRILDSAISRGVFTNEVRSGGAAWLKLKPRENTIIGT